MSPLRPREEGQRTSDVTTAQKSTAMSDHCFHGMPIARRLLSAVCPRRECTYDREKPGAPLWLASFLWFPFKCVS